MSNMVELGMKDLEQLFQLLNKYNIAYFNNGPLSITLQDKKNPVIEPAPIPQTRINNDDEDLYWSVGE